MLQFFDQDTGTISPDTQDDGHPASDFRNDEFYYPRLFFFRQRRSLGRSPENHEIIGTILKLVIDQAVQRLIIYTFIFLKWSNQGYSHSF